MRMGIFGGSFDPIHNGHIHIVKTALASFDRIIVVPAFCSPFKQNQKNADACHRVNMARLAFEGMSGVEVSDFEVSQSKPVFSIDTLNAFCRLYPNDYLGLIVGSDSLQQLKNWNSPNQLAKFDIFVAKRPHFGQSTLSDIVQFQELFGGNFFILEDIAPDISSSEIKICRAFDKLDATMLPQSIIDYIYQHQLYLDYCAFTSQYKKYGLSKNRSTHIFYTALMAVRLAKKFGVPSNKAVIAALLHDIAKNMTFEDAVQGGYNPPQDILSLPQKCRHGDIGALVAAKDFGIDDDDILNAIKNHTAGRAAMSPLEKIVFVADYVEQGRSFEGLQAIRSDMYSDLDKTVCAILKNTLDYLTSKNAQIDARSIQAYEYYQLSNKSKQKY